MINNKNTIRLLFDLFILISMFFLPWWSIFLFVVIGVILFKNYYEILFFGLWIDSVYFNGVFGKIPFMFSLLSGIMLVASPYLRSRLNF